MRRNLRRCPRRQGDTWAVQRDCIRSGQPGRSAITLTRVSSHDVNASDIVQSTEFVVATQVRTGWLSEETFDIAIECSEIKRWSMGLLQDARVRRRCGLPVGTAAIKALRTMELHGIAGRNLENTAPGRQLFTSW